ELSSSGNWLDTSGGQPIRAIASDAYLSQTPMLGELVFKLPLKCGLTPYVGGGVGGVLSTLYMRGFAINSWDQDFVLAYQGMAGLKYNLNEKLAVGVAYKLLYAEDQTYFGDSPPFTVRTGRTISHSILATFTWSF